MKLVKTTPVVPTGVVRIPLEFAVPEIAGFRCKK
jgi:hypothetical protein